MTQIGNNTGWICPRCNKVNAPSVQQCSCSPSNGNGYGGYLGRLAPTCHMCGQFLGMGTHVCTGSFLQERMNNEW